MALSLEESLPMARRFWYKNSDKFHPTTSKPLQMFQKMFSTTFEERSESVKTIKRDESHLNHDMEAPVRLQLYNYVIKYRYLIDLFTGCRSTE